MKKKINKSFNQKIMNYKENYKNNKMKKLLVLSKMKNFFKNNKMIRI